MEVDVECFQTSNGEGLLVLSMLGLQLSFRTPATPVVPT